MDEITLSQHDPNSAPILLIGLSHPEITDMDELRKTAEGYLQNGLIRLEGIAAVEIIGGEEKEVVIETNEYLMKAYNLDISTLANKISSTNLNETGGSIEELGKKYIIKGMGEFKSLQDIANTIVTKINNQQGFGNQNQESVPVYLNDVAQIKYENKEPENIVRINQKRSIALAIYKETKFNTVKAVELVHENLVGFKNALPGYEFQIVRNQAEFIETAINEVEESALIGIILAVIILYIFLRRIGTTLIISIAIPISVVATFNLMYFNDLTVNIMTLGGLALGAGMLVDNAIVVMENIFRNLEQGLSIKEAAIQGTAQVSGAITASTITTIVVFLPIVYLHGAAGELFKEQAWTVAFSLISSLFVAILVIPMLSTKFLKLNINTDKTESIHFTWYRDFLEKVLDRKNTIIFGALALIVFTILLIPTIGSEFVPRADTNSFSINVKLQEGSTLDFTNRVTSKLEGIVNTVVGEDLESMYTQIGPASGLSQQTQNLFADENTASIDVNLHPKRIRTTDRIIASLSKIFEDMTELEIQFNKEESSLQSILGTNNEQIVVEVKGEELELIKELTEQIKVRLDSVLQLINVESSFKEGRPEINIYVDRTLSGVNNLGISSISEQLKNQIEGKDAGYWDSEGELRDIVVRYPEMSLAVINQLKVNNGVQDIKIDEIASLETSVSQKEILRTNQTRVGKVSAQKADDTALDKVVGLIEYELQKVQFPEGYQYAITGEEQKRAESFSSLQFALLLSIILIYMVLASQFESLVHPFTILLTIPLAAVGAVLIFFVLGKSLNVMAYIGIIMLVGIAVNDSIILVDTINKLIGSGMLTRDSILEAGQRRIRPIVMTSITTILALLPLTIGFGESAALRSPMALAVIGGLITSTILTLVVIPCVYFVFENLRTVKEAEL